MPQVLNLAAKGGKRFEKRKSKTQKSIAANVEVYKPIKFLMDTYVKTGSDQVSTAVTSPKNFMSNMSIGLASRNASTIHQNMTMNSPVKSPNSTFSSNYGFNDMLTASMTKRPAVKTKLNSNTRRHLIIRKPILWRPSMHTAIRIK